MFPQNWLQQFVDDGTISADQLHEAEEMASSLGLATEDVLVRLGYVTAERLGQAKAAGAYGFQFVNLEGVAIPHIVIEMVPESVARENNVIPFQFENEKLTVAVVDPMNFEVVEKLRFILKNDVEIVMSAKESILAAINRHYGQNPAF